MKILETYVVPFWVELLFCVTILVMISRARKGKTLPEIHRVAGLDALDEAIGRCTEMGRPVRFTPGIGGFGDSQDGAQTMAAMSILGYVAKKCAKYDTDFVMANRSIRPDGGRGHCQGGLCGGRKGR